MSGWWVGLSELDDDQRSVIEIPIEDDAYIVGPPGSGKTNLLLLRANFLFLSGYKNIAVLTFTRALREYVTLGAHNYKFPPGLLQTCRQWSRDVIRQCGGAIPDDSGDFSTARTRLLEATQEIASKCNEPLFEAILLDEAQDCLPGEIETYRRLGRRLFCVADARQKIYATEDCSQTIRDALGEPMRLRFHYRNGRNICRVADAIAVGLDGHSPLVETSNYDERENPSTVNRELCPSLSDQATRIVERVKVQLDAFPRELIGILCPKVEVLEQLHGCLIKSGLSGEQMHLLRGNSEPIPRDKHVLLSTIHAAKGLEFRALHLASCEDLKRFENNRKIAFTAVTRAKTALSVYHSKALHGYLHEALELDAEIKPPALKRIFGGDE